MVYPTYTKQDLADFSGRDVVTYTAYAETSALPQATLLFKIGTCLADFPTDPTQAALAKMAILSMADAIVLVQPYQTVIANPFSSETIGSYSYSKVASAVASGLPTGIAWFDLAIKELSVCDINDNIPSGGGVEVFEYDGLFAPGVRKGNALFLSPRDIDSSRTFGYDPAPGTPYGYQIPDDGGLDLGDFTQDGGLLEG